MTNESDFMKQRQCYKFTGSMTANSNLAVSRAGDGFYPTEKITRIPRNGSKEKDTPGYWPAGTIEGPLRRATRDVLRKGEQARVGESEENPFDIFTNYLHSSGIVSKSMEQDVQSGTEIFPGKKLKLREKNPGLSLHGMWGLSAHWGIDNAYPIDKDAILLVGEKYRQNEYVRTPEEVERLDSDEQDMLTKILLEDAAASADVQGLNKEKADLVKQLKTTKTEADKRAVQSKIATLESKIKAAKSDKTYFNETIQRPIDQYECIKKGTVMSHKMTLASASELELGLLLASLREFARFPFQGGRFRDHCGETSASYVIEVWPADSDPVVLGEVYYGFMEFGFKQGSEELEAILKKFDEIKKDFPVHGIDVSAVN